MQFASRDRFEISLLLLLSCLHITFKCWQLNSNLFISWYGFFLAYSIKQTQINAAISSRSLSLCVTLRCVKAHWGFLLSGLISWPDPPVVLMAGSGGVKLPNKEPDCSVNVLLPVGVTAPEWSRVASAGRNPHIRAITGQPGFHLASQLARQSASQLPQPVMEEMDFTKAVCVTWHPVQGTWWSKLGWATSHRGFDTKEFSDVTQVYVVLHS